MTVIVIFVLLSIVISNSDGSGNREPRQNQGFVQVTNSDKVAVQLHCAPKFMNVVLRLTEGPFYDYISIGQMGDRPECRFQGNGSSFYELQIHLMGDRCGTTMVTDSGTFENVIRIGAHPTVVLDSDERVVVRCLYGRPKVDQPSMPPYEPAPQRIVIDYVDICVYKDWEGWDWGLGTPTPDPVNQDLRDDSNFTDEAGISTEHIILIVFLVLILALIFLLCGCLYFFFKRRKVRVERRNKLLVAGPQNPDKLDLWWPGGGHNKVGVSNDALLSHDYMISSNSTREQLSVSVESPTGSGSSGSVGSAAIHDSPQNGSGSVYMHETKHMIPRAHGDMPVGRLVHSLQSIPEERLKNRQLAAKHETPVTYGKVDKSNGGDKGAHGNDQQQILHVHTTSSTNFREITEMKMTEVYRNSDHPAETESISTLEGGQYSGIVGSPKMSNGTDSAVVNLDAFFHAVDANRGCGPNQLTDDDVRRWRGLLSHDRDLTGMLVKARTLENFEAIARRSPYNTYYSKEKWAVIVQSLAHLAFMQKLSHIIDNQGNSDQPGIKERDMARYASEAAHHQAAAVLKTLTTKPNQESDQPTHPVRLATVDGLAQQLRQKDHRLFTRESYHQVKNDVDSNSETDYNLPIEHASRSGLRGKGGAFDSVKTVSSYGGNTTHDRSTTELAEPIPTISTHQGGRPIGPNGTLPGRHFRERSSSETFENPPQLSLYVGNVSQRDIRESVQTQERDSLYNAIPGVAVGSNEVLHSSNHNF